MDMTCSNLATETLVKYIGGRNAGLRCRPWGRDCLNLPETRPSWSGQIRSGGIDRGLNVLRRLVDLAGQVELDGDRGRSEGTDGGDLRNSSNAA